MILCLNSGRISRSLVRARQTPSSMCVSLLGVYRCADSLFGVHGSLLHVHRFLLILCLNLGGIPRSLVRMCVGTVLCTWVSFTYT